MRTDSEMLDWLLEIFNAKIGPNGMPEDTRQRFEAINAAYQLGLRGRHAIAAAMGAQIVQPGAPLPPEDGAALIARKRATLPEDVDLDELDFVEYTDEEAFRAIDQCVLEGAKLAARVDRWLQRLDEGSGS